MSNTFASLSFRFRSACSLVYASAQLLKMFCALLVIAAINDWQRPTKSQSSQPLALSQDLDAALDDPDGWIPEDLTEEDITAIWLDLLGEPEVQQSCTHHLSRCFALQDASKISPNS